MAFETPDWENTGKIKPEFSEEKAHKMLDDLIKASESSDRAKTEKMYGELKNLEPEDLNRMYFSKNINREVKMAVLMELRGRGLEPEKPKKKPRKRKRNRDLEAAIGQASGGNESDINFEDDVVTSGGGGSDVNFEDEDMVTGRGDEDVPEESEDVEVKSNTKLYEIIDFIVKQNYGGRKLSNDETVIATAAEKVARRLEGVPLWSFNILNSPNPDIQDMIKKMDRITSAAVHDVESEFERVNSKREAILKYGTEKARGDSPKGDNGTVQLYGNEIARYINDGDSPDEAYARMIIKRVSERLFNSLSVTLANDL